MPRAARIVIPGHPHHVTQRGARSMPTFFSDDDYRSYLALLGAWCANAGTEIWAYCLMPEHLVLTPADEDGLRAALGETHRRYTRRINAREDLRGHLWQERFHSFVMDEAHLLNCVRHVELNPVRARLVRRPERWRWSSTRAHLAGRDDGVVRVAPMVERVVDWRAFIDEGVDDAALETVRAHARTGHPLGADAFLGRLEGIIGRTVKPSPRGRPKKVGTS